MSMTWIPVGSPCMKPSEHPAGTLIAVAPQSKKAPTVCWALRFDDVQDGEETGCLYLLNGSPLGPAGENNVMSCRDGHIDDLAVIGIGPPNFRVEIEFDPNDWIRDNDIAWYDAKAHVAIGEFGARLCGFDQYRRQQSRVWIDCATWRSDLEAPRLVNSRANIVTAYARTWRVIARGAAEQCIVVPFGHPKAE